MERKQECWEQVAKTLGPHIHGDSRAIIEHSYQYLPYHLRSCFLYFGAFLEDNVINSSKLTRLWISEGFVKSCEGKSLEDIAEGYLENLIGRSLVTYAKRGSDGKAKACRIHDLLHDFCQERAKEDNLLLSIRWDQIDNASSDVDSHKQPAPRLSISGKNLYSILEFMSPSWSLVGAVILHGNFLRKSEVTFFCQSFMFLKVLDLESTCIEYFPTELVYLRYFAAETKMPIPSSVVELWNLETLALKCSRGELSLPATIWEMAKLTHLHIRGRGFVIDNADELLENSEELYGLKTLSFALFTCVDDAEKILRKTPNLQELRCEINGVDNYQCNVLNFPSQLETLKVHCRVSLFRDTIPFGISAPNLRSLRLSGFHLVPCHLSNIGLLQKLQELKLYYITFDNKEWKVSNGEFPQLKLLKLHLCGSLRKWTVSDDAFPNLECLFLSFCKHLEEIPPCFSDLSSLKSIDVRNCNKSVVKSAMDIHEAQVEDYQNSGFKVFIQERAG